MATELTIAKRRVDGSETIYTRSDGEVFHADLYDNGHVSLYHSNRPPDGVDLHPNIWDRGAYVEKLILAYRGRWAGLIGCPDCGRTGKVSEAGDVISAAVPSEPTEKTCPRCEGTGIVDTHMDAI